MVSQGYPEVEVGELVNFYPGGSEANTPLPATVRQVFPSGRTHLWIHDWQKNEKSCAHISDPEIKSNERVARRGAWNAVPGGAREFVELKGRVDALERKVAEFLGETKPEAKAETKPEPKKAATK